MNAEKAISNLSNEDARAILLQLLNTKNGSEASISKISIQKSMDAFLRSKKNSGLSTDTIEGYLSTFSGIAKVIDIEGDISTITQDTTEKYIEYLSNRGPSEKKLSKSSINRRLRECMAWLNGCKRRGYITRAIEITQFKVNLDPVYINEKKMNEILAQMKPEQREFIQLYLSSGARLREIFHGELQSDNYLTIDSSLSKSRRTRELELSDEEVGIYRRLMACGLSAERLSRLFKIACVKAGYPEHHFHHIRHSMAVREINRSGKIYEISKRLGHSSVKVTESAYLRYSERRIRQDYPSLFDAE